MFLLLPPPLPPLPAMWILAALLIVILASPSFAGSPPSPCATYTDACGQCVSNPSYPPFCMRDCTGALRTSAASMNFLDNCGSCVAAGSNPNANKDTCGVCFGANASMNACGVCGGSSGVDGCGQAVCLEIICIFDCDGILRSPLTHYINSCGTCLLLTSVSISCAQDCAGDLVGFGPGACA